VSDRASLTRFAWLAVAAAVLTIGIKSAAYAVTGSVGLLSDAVEGLVNLAGALMALAMLSVAARPPDEDHAYGHSKAEYFSSVVEGMLIVIAAISIAIAGAERLLHPREIEQIGVGLAISVVATLLNLVVAIIILRAGKRHRSVTLEADARHLFADIWTSIGVIAGVGAVKLTGWQPLDPLIAFVVAGNIIFTGYRIIRESVSGLMDKALPAEDQDALKSVLAGYAGSGAEFHAIRTRRAGPRRFVSMHVLVPGDWTVQRGHQLLERIEADVRAALADVAVFTHLESLDDPSSFDDVSFDRKK
jgi:cation diffusion facilitator family transporter